MDEVVQELDEDIEGLQSAIQHLQQQLRSANERSVAMADSSSSTPTPSLTLEHRTKFWLRRALRIRTSLKKVHHVNGTRNQSSLKKVPPNRTRNRTFVKKSSPTRTQIPT